MNLSDDWKSLYPIGAVFSAPLLLSNSSLGPLFFNPDPETLTQLFASPSLSPPLLNPPSRLSLLRFLSTSTSPYSPILPSTASSISSSFHPGPHLANDAASLLSHNRLQLLKYSTHGLVVFFSTGSNHDQVGFLLLSVKGKSLAADGSVSTAKKAVGQRIVRILVNPIEGNCAIGYLLVYTLYSVHWFRVKVSSSENDTEKPELDYIGCKLFKTCAIAGACWSTHLPEESGVLLEDGSLFLFDLESDCGASTKYFRGTRVKVSWDGVDNLDSCGKWLGCEFSWHPRVLVVARSDAVFLVDWRCGKGNVTCLANIGMLGVYASAEKDQFLTFSKSASDGFSFVLVSDSMLVLCDLRRPLSPVLQWAHGLDKPCYVDVFRLSELRSNSRDYSHDWANSSGYGIVVGSFWNCEFSLCCYGPPFPAHEGSIASEISKISKSAYAWELPSELLLSGKECHCGSCLVREEFWKDSNPCWIDWQYKKDIVLGFGILSQDISSLLFEPDDFGGFTVIRLMSSGKLECQRYCASWDLVRKLEAAHLHSPARPEDNFLYELCDERYKFPRKFKYLKLDYLRAYLDGNLSQILDLNMSKPWQGPQEKESFSLELHEILCEKLKICGFGCFRTTSAINAVFNDINLPTSVHEVALRKIWASLPIELLQLAFSSYSEFLDVLLDQKKASLEFSVVPDLPQLPPFFLRKPSIRSSKWSHKVQRPDAAVGSVLPLPLLITLHEFRNGCPHNSQEERGGFSAEVELNNHCDEVMQVVREMAVSDSTVSTTELQYECATSLADDRDDIRINSENSKSFLLHRSISGHNAIGDNKKANGSHEDERHAFLISKVRRKEPGPTRSNKLETVGREFFDDLCPIDLKFDAGPVNFSSKETKAYNLLKRQFSKWQREFKPYQEFCSQFSAQKHQ